MDNAELYDAALRVRGAPVQAGRVPQPKSRLRAGASVREWVDAIQALTQVQVRRVARSPKAPCLKRAAALLLLRAVDYGDLADFEPRWAPDATKNRSPGRSVTRQETAIGLVVRPRAWSF